MSMDQYPAVGHNGGPTVDDETARNGWVKIYRDIREHPLVGFGQPVSPADPKRGAFSRAEAFTDLIMEAEWKDTRRRVNGEIVELNVGQLLASQSYLATRWNWTRQRVRTFVHQLLSENMIKSNQLSEQQKGCSRKKGPNVITVSNYSKFQGFEEAITDYVNDVRKPSEQPTSNQLATNCQPTSNHNQRREEYNNINNNYTRARARGGGNQQNFWQDQFSDPNSGAQFIDGKLKLFNGTRQFWLKKFGGDEERLELALHQAAGFVQPNNSKPLEAQVGAQLARIVSEKRDKDQRYATAAKHNAGARNSSGGTSDAADQYERIARENGINLGGQK